MKVRNFNSFVAESADVVLTTDMLSWNKETNTFSKYLSDLRGMGAKIAGGEKTITIRNPKRNSSRVFTFTELDTDGEDIFGWNYENKEEGLHLLIIND